ncbi:MAG: zinc-ribbon domain-containing protein, partial [Proteobacteria bacterium]|nr:zinc-ribbon domain-containing protein [Pseudomonadota bacterium]
MIITCNECNTPFNLNESFLKQTGSKVRCSNCKNVFLAYPSSLSEEPDKSSEVMPETEVEAAIPDEETELELEIDDKAISEISVEEELEGIELTADETFEEDTKVEKEPEELSFEPGLDLEPEGIELEADEAVEETEIEESKAEEIDEDIIPEEETAKAFNLGTLSDEQKAEKSTAIADKIEEDTIADESQSKVAAAKTRISMPTLLLLLAALLISGAYGTYVLL